MFEMPAPATVHISSAAVSVLPAYIDDVVRQIAGMPGIEVHYRSDTKIVIVIEAPDSGTIGSQLAEIAGLPGVLSANMVFEQVELLEGLES
jgi:nitrate reductase NapD